MKFHIIFALCFGNLIVASENSLTTDKPPNDLIANENNTQEPNFTIVFPVEIPLLPVEIKIDTSNTSTTTEHGDLMSSPSETVEVPLLQLEIKIDTNTSSSTNDNNSTTKSTETIVVQELPESLIIKPIVVKEVDETTQTVSTGKPVEQQIVKENKTASLIATTATTTTTTTENIVSGQRKQKEIESKFPKKAFESKYSDTTSDWKPSVMIDFKSNPNILPTYLRPQQLVGENKTVLTRVVRNKNENKTREWKPSPMKEIKNHAPEYTQSHIMGHQPNKEIVVRNSIKINTDVENNTKQHIYPVKPNENKENSYHNLAGGQMQGHPSNNHQHGAHPYNTSSTNTQVHSFITFSDNNKNHGKVNNQIHPVYVKLQDNKNQQKLNPINNNHNSNMAQMISRVKKDSQVVNALEFEHGNDREPTGYDAKNYKNLQSEWKPSAPSDYKIDKNRRIFLKLGAAFLGYNAFKAYKSHNHNQNQIHNNYDFHEYGKGVTEIVSQSQSPHGHKIIEVIKKVPVLVPYTVKVPVYKTIAVRVPKPYPFPVEKRVPYIVEMPVPYPVKVPVNVPYEVKVPIKVPHPVLHTVKKLVPYPVEVPHVIEKKVPVVVSNHDSVHHGDITPSHFDSTSFLHDSHHALHSQHSFNVPEFKPFTQNESLPGPITSDTFHPLKRST